jgi:hypothetical protein
MQKLMPEPTLTLVHVLAADPPENGKIRTRSTVRTGVVQSGDRLWFEGVDRKRRDLTVVSVDHGDRWSTIVFSGRPQDLARIVTGTYVHSQSGAGSAIACKPWWPAGRTWHTSHNA